MERQRIPRGKNSKKLRSLHFFCKATEAVVVVVETFGQVIIRIILQEIKNNAVERFSAGEKTNESAQIRSIWFNVCC